MKLSLQIVRNIDELGRMEPPGGGARPLRRRIHLASINGLWWTAWKRAARGHNGAFHGLVIDIEIVALNLTGANPIPVIDRVGDALANSGNLKEYYGHVTVLK